MSAGEVAQIGILLFPDVEELDAVGPYEVLAHWTQTYPQDGYAVSCLSVEGGPVRCAKGLTVLAERLGVEAPALQPLLDKLARVGWLCRASASYYLLPEVAAGLADAARRVAAENATGLLTVGRFREATGIARHATMPVLEYFDRTGLTRRVPEGREIREAHPRT